MARCDRDVRLRGTIERKREKWLKGWRSCRPLPPRLPIPQPSTVKKDQDPPSSFYLKLVVGGDVPLVLVVDLFTPVARTREQTGEVADSMGCGG